MEVRAFDMEGIALDEGLDTKEGRGYNLSAARVRKAIKKRYENIRAYANGYRQFTPYEWACLKADAQALAEDGKPSERSMYAGLAFTLLTQH